MSLEIYEVWLIYKKQSSLRQIATNFSFTFRWYSKLCFSNEQMQFFQISFIRFVCKVLRFSKLLNAEKKLLLGTIYKDKFPTKVIELNLEFQAKIFVAWKFWCVDIFSCTTVFSVVNSKHDSFYVIMTYRYRFFIIEHERLFTVRHSENYPEVR